MAATWWKLKHPSSSSRVSISKQEARNSICRGFQFGVSGFLLYLLCFSKLVALVSRSLPRNLLPLFGCFCHCRTGHVSSGKWFWSVLKSRISSNLPFHELHVLSWFNLQRSTAQFQLMRGEKNTASSTWCRDLDAAQRYTYSTQMGYIYSLGIGIARIIYRIYGYGSIPINTIFLGGYSHP